MPGLDGPEVEALYAKGKSWLEGKRTLKEQQSLQALTATRRTNLPNASSCCFTRSIEG